MSKWTIIKLMLLPLLRTAAGILATKDEGTTGMDDLLAGQMNALAASLEAWDGKADPGFVAPPK